MIHTSQITVQSLACIDVQILRSCFNAAFKNYYVPIQLSREQFADKLITEAIDLKLSFGIFDSDELVGFILNGIDITEMRDGTGIEIGNTISHSLFIAACNL